MKLARFARPPVSARDTPYPSTTRSCTGPRRTARGRRDRDRNDRPRRSRRRARPRARARRARRARATIRERPIVMLVDTSGQRLSRRDELLGINGYLGHLAQCLEDRAATRCAIGQPRLRRGRQRRLSLVRADGRRDLRAARRAGPRHEPQGHGARHQATARAARGLEPDLAGVRAGSGKLRRDGRGQRRVDRQRRRPARRGASAAATGDIRRRQLGRERGGRKLAADIADRVAHGVA